MRAAKRDANEREFVETWRALGAVWFAMPPETGFDGLLLFQGKLHVVEVKDTRQTNGRYTLTENEQRAAAEVEDRGVPYEVITNMTEALALVGAA